MAIENSVSKDFYLRSSIVLKFSIAAYPVCGPACMIKDSFNLTNGHNTTLHYNTLNKTSNWSSLHWSAFIFDVCKKYERYDIGILYI